MGGVPSSFLSFGSFLGRTLFLLFPMCYVNTAVKAEARHRLKPLKLGGKTNQTFDLSNMIILGALLQ